MKNKIFRVSKSTLSIILSLMMIISTMMIGTITTANAAGGNFVGGSTIYFIPTDDWKDQNANFAVDFYNPSSGSGHKWVRMTYSSTYGRYYATIPGGSSVTWGNAIFVRLNPNSSATSGSQWVGDDGVNVWNQTGDLSGVSGQNCYTLPSSSQWDKPGDSSDGKSCWSYYSTVESHAYSLIGPLVSGDTSTAGWQNAYAMIKNSSGVYTYNVSVSDVSKSYFRLVLSNNTDHQFGPASGDDKYDITAKTSESNSYTTTDNHGNRSFTFGRTGKYTIYAKQLNNDDEPKVWVDRTGDIEGLEYRVMFDVYDSSLGLGRLTAKVGSQNITSGDNVASNSTVVFTAVPAEGCSVEGWYSDSACTKKITGTGTSNSYSVTVVSSEVSVYVKFTEGSQVVVPEGDPPVLHKYERRDGNGAIESTGATDLLNAKMTYHNDGTYEFYYYHISSGGQYLYNITLDGTTYYKGVSKTDQYPDSVYITVPWSGFNNVFETGNNISSYYIIYTPTNTADKRISVVTTFPDPTPKYRVTMEQGISGYHGAMGTSYLENDPSKTQISNKYDDLVVTFTTETLEINSGTLDYKGYMYQVYGYSVLMTLKDNTKRVVGVFNPIDDPNSTRRITNLGNGKYTYEFIFPDDIKSAVVTPIFTVSDDYAQKKNITFTKIYLKAQPGANALNNQYEPRYFTWRSTTDGDTVEINGIKLERLPEGGYPGQKLVRANDDMYVAYVQSDVYGLLFDDGKSGTASDPWRQTFDYDEFRKLQKLGYNNITFEIMDSKDETIGENLNKNTDGYGNANKTLDNGSKTYFTVADDGTVTYNTGVYTINAAAKTNEEFILDINIEGNYIDVFGNVLLDSDGKEINRDDFVKKYNLATVSDELNKLLEVTGKTDKLYGARYGWYTTTDSNYGMEYAVRTYFIDGNDNKLISQQISGYGQIEGAMSPKDSSKTNAEQDGSLVYYTGNRTSDSVVSYTENTFSTGYELVPEKYVGVPYLVSYKSPENTRATDWDKYQEGATRVDGKWYYMSRTPQITINAKVGLMNETGELIMAGNSIKEQTDTGCTATVNNLPSVTINQGTNATLGAKAATGFTFVGFYYSDGEFIIDSNPFELAFASNTTIFAVFKPIESGTLEITNNIYGYDNPPAGKGNGSVSVTLYITPYDSINQTYGSEVSYEGKTSTSALINDGDKYRWEITGTPSGIDTFIAFRQPETNLDGVTYYIELDDEDCLTQNGSTYTYSSYTCVWNWYQQTGSTKITTKTFNYFTDFNKTSVKATLHYKYKNRFGEPRTYTVRNVDLTQAEDYDVNNPYTPTNSVILKNAPPIDEVFTTCTWNVDDVNMVDIGTSVATLTADQDTKKFWTHVLNGMSLEPDSTEAYFNTLITISAPESITVGGVEKKFSYWKRYLTDALGNYDEVNDPYDIFSYQREVGIRVSFNSMFVAVFGEETVPYMTSLQDAIYTREKYTDENGKTADYVYADFLVQFETSNLSNTFAEIVKNNYDADTNTYKIKYGIVTERDTAAAPYDGTDMIIPDKNTDLVDETILTIAKDLSSGASKSGWSLSDKGSDQYNYYYTAYDLTNKVDNLTTLGRYDFYFRFTNNEINRSRVYNVYSYIIYTDEAGNDKIVISNGKTMCIYDTGIKEDGQTTTTTTS